FLPFTHAATLLALHLLVVLVLGGLASDLTATGLQVATPLGWLSVAGVMSALLFLLRDPDAPAWGLPAPALYAAGALAVGLALHARKMDLPRYATLGAAVLALAEVGWGLLDPGLPAPWLHLSVMLLVAVALAGFVCGTVLLRVLAAATAWAACVRRTAVALGGL